MGVMIIKKAVKATSENAKMANVKKTESCDKRMAQTSSSVFSLMNESLYLNRIRFQNESFELLLFGFFHFISARL